MSVFKRKAFYALKDWKENFAPHYAALLEGARRGGKSTIAEEFAKEDAEESASATQIAEPPVSNVPTVVYNTEDSQIMARFMAVK